MLLAEYFRRWLSPKIQSVNQECSVYFCAKSPLTTRLYLLFGAGIPGLPPAIGGVFDPFPLMVGKWLLEWDFPECPNVAGGEVLSNHELSVDELLFPLLLFCDRGSSLPSLLDEELWSEV